MSNNFLKEIREKKRLSLAELAEQVGVSRQLLWGYEKGKNNLSKLVIEKIAKILNVNEKQILGEESIFFVDDSIKNQNEILVDKNSNIASGDLITINKFDVKASAGDGIIIDGEEITAGIAFEKNFLKKITSANPKNLAFISVSGDSMSPTFKDGDYILVDKSNKDATSWGIFVIRMGNVLKVKRIIVDPFAKKFRILSDNTAEVNGRRLYPDYEITFDQAKEDLCIEGKVVWATWKLD